jgi:hypothetical protein
MMSLRIMRRLINGLGARGMTNIQFGYESKYNDVHARQQLITIRRRSSVILGLSYWRAGQGTTAAMAALSA